MQNKIVKLWPMFICSAVKFTHICFIGQLPTPDNGNRDEQSKNHVRFFVFCNSFDKQF